MFFLSDKYIEDFCIEFRELNLNYFDVLKKWRNGDESFILILGEISVGKLMLINKILGKMLFKGWNNEFIFIICKLCNLERIWIFIIDMMGEIEVIDLLDSCDLEIKEGVKMLRNYLKE